jgi:hypothetical protein
MVSIIARYSYPNIRVWREIDPGNVRRPSDPTGDGDRPTNDDDDNDGWLNRLRPDIDLATLALIAGGAPVADTHLLARSLLLVL